MPSAAYVDVWKNLHRPAVDALVAVLNDYGVPPAARATNLLVSAESEAVARGGIVALTAAFQAYVVELFNVTAQSMTRSASAVQRLRTAHIEGKDAAHRPFGNPHPQAVGALFNALLDVLLPGTDIWAGVTVGSHTWQGAARGSLSADQTREFVREHITLRNRIAHGESLPMVTLQDLSERLAVFDEIVLGLDGSAKNLIAQHTGSAPW